MPPTKTTTAPAISTILTLSPPGPLITSKALTAFSTGASDDLFIHPNPNVRLFADAVSVREAVFVKEQACPWTDEIDADDARSWHFTAYSGESYSEGRDRPVATLRLVPGPHVEHPRNGSVDGVGGEHVRVEGGQAGGDGRGEADGKGEGEGGDSGDGMARRDVRTKMHDGRERYVKLGRVATVKEMRGKGLGRKMMEEAMKWAVENRGELQGKEGEEGAEGVGREWKGLVMVHAQRDVVGMYEKCGFEVDEMLGEWMEVGIPHVALWKRLEL